MLDIYFIYTLLLYIQDTQTRYTFDISLIFKLLLALLTPIIYISICPCIMLLLMLFVTFVFTDCNICIYKLRQLSLFVVTSIFTHKSIFNHKTETHWTFLAKEKKESTTRPQGWDRWNFLWRKKKGRLKPGRLGICWVICYCDAMSRICHTPCDVFQKMSQISHWVVQEISRGK